MSTTTDRPVRCEAPHYPIPAFFPHERDKIVAAAEAVDERDLVALLETLDGQHADLVAQYQRTRFGRRARSLDRRVLSVWMNLHWHLLVRRAQLGLLPDVGPAVGPVSLPAGDDLVGG